MFYFKSIAFHISVLRIQGSPLRSEWDVICATILLVAIMFFSATYDNASPSEENIPVRNFISVTEDDDKQLQQLQHIGFFSQPGKMALAAQNPWRQGLVAEDDPALKLAPATSLPLKLTGILYSADATKRLAIFEQAGGQITLKEGNNIKGQPAQIRRIFTDMVIILTRGEYASVRLASRN